ncbi:MULTISPECIES: ABC transporter ATP-binding protein [Thalassospira]|jgi:putative ABC transport system ATP-binding protein|uniref:ABC transporter n=1 Tax=Thalassospira povalilytica TaxID=732237 RepID=A0ABX4R3Q1_9PROT|nr:MULTISPECIES: ABC transporter ATP-binding protein [Thalassospira]MEE3047520.1 ABC transporter ATP-binding protein [Pseudomonadota bacterium]MAL38479.1 ABC transporter [Thalassospira sp.]MCC4239676.1 ABC transporter ATP-binding protein [Thalassospira povalilytica]PKR47311.1 ABC transporter [Thalassospira povalilytica]URK16936.1 ABC transporter ATP-binding protein [Thalassospira sp. GO-4]|tara:strand:+ start:7104 stop:7850 length:747 start_codon:yes stop_codon:yes gene_type:complete
MSVTETTAVAEQTDASAGKKAEQTIDVRNLKLRLQGPAGIVEILKGVDLSLYAGERVSLVGPSGSGKTSLLMVIAGLEQAQEGVVNVCGNDLRALDEDGLALYRRHHVGIVFQDFHLIPTMSALENVALPMEFAGRKDAFEKARAELELVGLGHRTDHYPGQLSGGEQQRVALARALATDPELLLADEPTGNLDGATGETIIELLFDLTKRRGSTLLLITHDPGLAERCDRTVMLRDGEIVSQLESRS